MFPLENKLSWKERLAEERVLLERSHGGKREGGGLCNGGEVAVNINRWGC